MLAVKVLTVINHIELELQIVRIENWLLYVWIHNSVGGEK